VDEDGTLNATTVLVNDDDTHGGAPNENNVPLTAQLVSGPANAAAFSLNNDGTFNYSPELNFNGNDSFTYEAVDSLGGVSNIFTALITVAPVNDAPVFTRGLDPAVKANNGPTVVTGFVTTVLPGLLSPLDEAGQALSFQLTTTGSLTFVAGGEPRIELQTSDPTAGDLMFETVAGSHGCATIDVRLSDNGGTANSGVDESTQIFSLCAAPTSVQMIENPNNGAIEIHVVDLLTEGKPDQLKLELNANGDLVVTDLDFAVVNLTSDSPTISNSTIVSFGAATGLTVDLMGGDDTLEIDFHNSPIGFLDRSLTINGGAGFDVLTFGGMVSLGSGSLTAGESDSPVDPSKKDLESILVNGMITGAAVTLIAQMNLELNAGIITGNLGDVQLTAIEEDILGSNCATIDGGGLTVNLHGSTGIAGVVIVNQFGTVTMTSSAGAIVGCDGVVSVTADTLRLDAATSIGAALLQGGQLTDVTPLRTRVAKLSLQASGLGIFIANDGPVDILQAPPSASLLGGVHIWPLVDGEVQLGSIGEGEASPWQNALNPWDVNNDSIVTSIDALVVINYLNLFGVGSLSAQRANPMPYVDVNGDWSNSALDVLQVINYLNQTEFAMAEGESLPLRSTIRSDRFGIPWWATPPRERSGGLHWFVNSDERADVEKATRRPAAVVEAAATRAGVRSLYDRPSELSADVTADELELIISEIAVKIAANAE